MLEEKPMTAQRPHPLTERPLDAPLLTFDLASLLTQLKREDPWQQGTRNSMTLLKGQGLRVVLVALHAGAVIPSHRTESSLSLQVIEGVITFRTEAQALMLGKGQLLTLQPGIPHVVEAVEAAAFLLTFATETPHPVES
jgi:quercetin dioxygenase-like cupin family protein